MRPKEKSQPQAADYMVLSTIMNKYVVCVGALVLSFCAWCESAANKPAEKSVSATPAAAPIDDFITQSFVLKYAKATEVAASLNDLCRKLGFRESAVAFPESHTVAVAASPKVVEACAKIVADVNRAST